MTMFIPEFIDLLNLAPGDHFREFLIGTLLAQVSLCQARRRRSEPARLTRLPKLRSKHSRNVKMQRPECGTLCWTTRHRIWSRPPQVGRAHVSPHLPRSHIYTQLDFHMQSYLLFGSTSSQET